MHPCKLGYETPPYSFNSNVLPVQEINDSCDLKQLVTKKMLLRQTTQ